MGLTALGLLMVGLVNCVIVTQKKSKILLPCFPCPRAQDALLGASGAQHWARLGFRRIWAPDLGATVSAPWELKPGRGQCRWLSCWQARALEVLQGGGSPGLLSRKSGGARPLGK